MESNTAVVEKIKKLLALSESDNVHEAALAAATAQRLLLEHKLSMADITVNENDGIEEVDLIEDTMRVVSWRSILIASLAKNNFCTSYASATAINGNWFRKFVVVGKSNEANAVAYLFKYFTSEIDRLCDQAKTERNGYGKTWTNSFRIGAVNAIATRLEQERYARDRKFKTDADHGNAKANTALVVVKKSDDEIKAYMEKNHGNLHYRTHYSRKDYDAYDAGQRAGSSLRIPGNGKGINAPSKQLRGS